MIYRILLILLTFLLFSRVETVLAQDGSELTFLGHKDAITSGCLALDKRTFYTSSLDKTIRVWDLEDPLTTKVLYTGSYPITAMALSPNGKKIAFTTSKKQMIFIDINGKGLYTFNPIDAKNPYITCIKFNTRGDKLLYGFSDGNLEICNILQDSLHLFAQSKKQKIQLFYFDQVRDIDVDKAGNIAVAGENTYKIFDINLKEQEYNLEAKKHSNIVNCISYTTDGQFLATGSDDRSLKLWQKFGHNSVQMLADSSIKCLTISINKKYAATGGTDRSLYIWNLDSAMAMRKFGHKGTITSVHFIDENSIVTTSLDQTAKRWNFNYSDMIISMFYQDDIDREKKILAESMAGKTEFETQEEFDKRRESYQADLAKLDLKYRAKYKEMIDQEQKRIQSSEHAIQLQISEIEDYQPEECDQYFNVTLVPVATKYNSDLYEVVRGRLYVLREDAQTFKEHFTKSSVSGKAKLKTDLNSYEVVEGTVKVQHPYRKGLTYTLNSKPKLVVSMRVDSVSEYTEQSYFEVYLSVDRSGDVVNKITRKYKPSSGKLYVNPADAKLLVGKLKLSKALAEAVLSPDCKYYNMSNINLFSPVKKGVVYVLDKQPTKQSVSPKNDPKKKK